MMFGLSIGFRLEIYFGIFARSIHLKINDIVRYLECLFSQPQIFQEINFWLCFLKRCEEKENDLYSRRNSSAFLINFSILCFKFHITSTIKRGIMSIWRNYWAWIPQYGSDLPHKNTFAFFFVPILLPIEWRTLIWYIRAVSNLKLNFSLRTHSPAFYFSILLDDIIRNAGEYLLSSVGGGSSMAKIFQSHMHRNQQL